MPLLAHNSGFALYPSLFTIYLPNDNLQAGIFLRNLSFLRSTGDLAAALFSVKFVLNGLSGDVRRPHWPHIKVF